MMTQLEHVLWWAVLCYFVGSFAGPLLWHLLFRIVRVLPGVGDDEEPVISSVSAGRVEAMPWHWAFLCLDVRRHILSKVPLRYLAPAVATCPEFREEFRRRVGEERGRLISVAEASYGKDVVAAFVKSVQDGICRLHPFATDFIEVGDYLVIGAAGEHKVVPYKEVDKLLRDSCVAVFARRNPFVGRHILMTNRKNGGQRELVKIGLCTNGTCRMHMEASLTQGTGEAELGILLAICARNQEAIPSRPRLHVHPGKRVRLGRRWAQSPTTIPAIISGSKIRMKFKGPLGALNDHFFMYTL